VNVTVDLKDRSYAVVLRDGARDDLRQLLATRVPRAQVAAIVTSRSLASQPWFVLESGLRQHVLEVPDGEDAKNFSALEKLCEQLSDLQLSRHDVIVGVGGGAITDLAGFAAAVYLRGVALVQIPTSLVGQVDAAIGGKTGINLRSGKNLVGAFHQPVGVLCDFEVLATLPERERLSGLGEVAKCWLLEGRGAPQIATTSQAELISMSVRLKANIVSGDEREGGQRALLNYGHTLAHAVEKLALERSVDEVRHGEAVAIGLAFAARLAQRLGRVDNNEVANHDAVLAALGLDGTLQTHYATNDLLDAMGHDKKAHHDLTFVLAGPQGFEVVRGVESSVVAEVLERFRGES
jgi:5-deoxy-5-amino-3-dehydroquinate synthase